MESNRGVVTFRSVDEIQWCYELAVLSHGTIYPVCGSNF